MRDRDEENKVVMEVKRKLRSEVEALLAVTCDQMVVLQENKSNLLNLFPYN